MVYNVRFCLAERTVSSMNIYLSIYKLRVDSNLKKFAFLQFDIEQYSEQSWNIMDAPLHGSQNCCGEGACITQ